MAIMYDYKRMAAPSLAYLASLAGNKTTNGYRNNRSYTRTITKKSRSSKTIGGAVKKTILGMSSAYHSTVSDQTNGTGTVHNNIYSANLTAAIGQGTLNSTRQGDSIFLESLKIKGYMLSAATAGAYQFRLLIGWSGEEYNPSGLLTSGLTGVQLF